MIRNTIILFLLTICSSLYAQEGRFTVTGRVKNVQPDQLFILINGKYRDTLKFDRQGNFSSSCMAADFPSRAMIIRQDLKAWKEAMQKVKEKECKINPLNRIIAPVVDFFVQSGSKVEIKGDNNKFPFWSIKNDCLFDAFAMEFRQEREPLIKRRVELQRVYNDAVWSRNEEKVKQYTDEANAMNKEEYRMAAEWMKNHPDSEYTPYAYSDYNSIGDVPVEDMKVFYDALSERVKGTFYARIIANALYTRIGIQIGSVAPNFTLTDLKTGKSVSLSDFRGKHVILDFWGSWCKPCREGNPKLIEIYNKYKDHGFEVLGLAADKTVDAILKAAKEDGLPWTQLCLYEQRTGQPELVRLYNIKYYPTKMLIDPKGTILDIEFGDAENSAIFQKLEEIFK